MHFFADIHIHSCYSRATSREMNPENIFKWAQIKGITVIATGDFTHPLWFAELKKKLEPAEEGLFRLKNEFAESKLGEVPTSCRGDVRFILSAEVSSIYKKNGKVRKIHNLIYSPDFETASNINSELDKIGNLKADGRPILGLDAKELLRIVLNSGNDTMLVPAHAWTPHFSVFGASSGFDSLEECFEELTPNIHAIETGLSSDPTMNRRLSKLDNITLISNSDAHSPAKIAREANIFNSDLTYKAIKNALIEGNNNKFLGTIEFFPEEGKYHLDGHRACKKRMSPEDTKKNKNLCPVCKKKVTVGVMHRVDMLADREKNFKQENSPPYKCLIPLEEIISKALEKGANTKAVQKEYMKLINALGNELKVLQKADIEEIKKVSSFKIGEAIKRVKSGNISINPGYDGEYGSIKIFGNEKEEKVP